MNVAHVARVKDASKGIEKLVSKVIASPEHRVSIESGYDIGAIGVEHKGN